MDDDPHVVSAFESRLRPRLCLETATHPRAALNAVLSRSTYAVVVSDLRMPEMDGIELLSRIPRIPPGTVEKALQAGLEQYRLIKAERELLEQTPRGSIKVMTELLRRVKLCDRKMSLSSILHLQDLFPFFGSP